MTTNVSVIDIPPGYRIDKAIGDAIRLSGETGKRTSFTFNGVAVSVRSDSDPGLIERDWRRAMSGCTGKRVGPYPSPTLSDDEVANDARVEAANERDRQQRRAAFEVAAAAKRDAVEARLAEAPPMAVSNEAARADWRAKNTDPYGAGALDYADRWARLIQVEMAAGNTLEDVASATSHEADIDGVTGFMHGAAVSYLASCWEHGDQLRRWHARTQP